MAFSLNKVMLIGNLGRDAEHTFTPNNVSISKYSIATQSSYKGKDGNWVEDTQWHNIISWSLSDFFKEKLKKGAKIYVEGRIQTRTWDDNGVKKYFTEIISEKLIPLDGRGGGDSSYGGGGFTSPDSSGSVAPPADDKQDNDLPF